MIYKLFFRSQFISEHADFDDAQAQARWTYFEWTSSSWEGEFTPPGFLVACINNVKVLESLDKKVMCI